jgi:formylglycine-generating enzyme required for sulfatase activity
MHSVFHRAAPFIAAIATFFVSQPAFAAVPGLKFQPQTGLTITGSVATVYAVLSSTNLAQASDWRCLKFLQMPSTTYLMPGTAASASRPSCMYRVAAMSSSNLVFIPSGTFTMGSPTNEVDRFSDEGPQTSVTFSQGFWISKKLVTQQEFQSVMEINPSLFSGDPNLPVEQVTYSDATNYCAMRTILDWNSGIIPAGCHYRLPTEAEWEYCCRAGSTTRFNYGDDPNYANLAAHAWYAVNSANATHTVGLKPANAWGLFDMHGNVWEWCQDWYGGSYAGGSVTDPQGPPTGDYRVLRGGSWSNFEPASFCRSACRIADDPTIGSPNYGFRVVLVPSGP